MSIEDKIKIRKAVLGRRDALPRAAVEMMSRNICRSFIQLPMVRDSSSVMIFLSFGSEINTDYIIRWLWQRKKRVFVPLCKPKTREMDIIPITTFDDVEPGYYGIREPKGHLRQRAAKTELDLIVVPAVAFDRSGFRVGYGGGYYDRFMTGLNIPKIGLAFSCQLIPEVPRDQYDQAVQGIVTEQGYISIP